ncbi:MAG: hypothetical protein HQM12_13575 [SAR324 cluster bacterium]|nr:hypothetical protein [SAR324 cluster bacterium]
MSPVFSRTICVGLVLFSLGILGVSVPKLENRYSLQHRIESFLYLPKSNFFKPMTLGNEELAADFMFIQAAVYFGEHYREYARGKYQYVWLRQMMDLVTDLDPYYYDAYVAAGNLLDDPKESIAMYEKGIKYFPKDWKLYELVGFQYFYELNDKEKAAEYYEKAGLLGSPPYVPSLAGKFYQEAGYYDSAIRILLDAAEKTDRDAVKHSFLERAHLLTRIRDIQAVVEIFRKRQGRFPSSLFELELLEPQFIIPDVPRPWSLMLHMENGKVIYYVDQEKLAQLQQEVYEASKKALEDQESSSTKE